MRRRRGSASTTAGNGPGLPGKPISKNGELEGLAFILKQEDKIKNLLKGKKTHLMALGMVLYVYNKYHCGVDFNLEAFLQSADMKTVLEAGLFSSLRAGVEKAGLLSVLTAKDKV